MSDTNTKTSPSNKKKLDENTEPPRIKKVIISDETAQKKILGPKPQPEFKSKSAVISNDGVFLENDKALKCSEPGCTASFTNASTLSHHERKHFNRRIRCKFCSTTFKKVEAKTAHEAKFHPNLDEIPEVNPLQCMKCKKICTSAFTLKRHISRTHQDRKYPCPHCGFQYTQIEGLRQHLKHKHLGNGQEMLKFPCTLCDKVYLYSPDLRKHMQTAHRPKDGSERYHCVICKTVYFCKRVYGNHLRRHTKMDTFFCELCNFRTWNSTKLKEHQRSNKHKLALRNNKSKSVSVPVRKSMEELKLMTKEELFNFCWERIPKIILQRVDPNQLPSAEEGKVFKTLEDLKKMSQQEIFDFCRSKTLRIPLHRVDSSIARKTIAKPEKRKKVKTTPPLPGESFLKCVDCKIPYTDLKALQVHEKTCHLKTRHGYAPGDKLVCKVCNKQFQRRHQLLHHSIVHSTERPYKCHYCDNTFKRTECRLSHEKHVHFGFKRKEQVMPRIYTCNHSGCGKKYTRRRTLRRHILIEHLRTRFSCSSCHKVFTRPDYLKKHKEVNHAQELTLFECKPCKKTFKHRSNFLQHSQKPRHIRKMKAFSNENPEGSVKGKSKAGGGTKGKATKSKSRLKYESDEEETETTSDSESDFSDKSWD